MLVKVQTEYLKKQASAIENANQNFANGINNIRNINSEIGGIWQGNDYNNFSSQMTSFASELENLKNAIDSYKEFITGYATATEVLDDTYGSKTIDLE